MDHALDNPIWSALTSGHASLAVGERPALRYDQAYTPFVAVRDTSAASLAALGDLDRKSVV